LLGGAAGAAQGRIEVGIRENGTRITDTSPSITHYSQSIRVVVISHDVDDVRGFAYLSA
jgi:hypothetical protein